MAPLVLLAALAQPAAAARDGAPGFLSQALQLPGIPAAMLPADMDGDGRDDLVVLVAYTGWTTRSEFAQVKFDDIEGLVEVMNVVDALVDRRELRVYAGGPEGAGFGDQLAALDLDTSVHALATGHPVERLIAVTDDGAAAVRLVQGEDGARLTLTPLVASATTFAGGGRFYPDLELLHDLDGDGLPELLLPTAAGWAVHAGTTAGLAAEPAALIALPEPPPDDEDEDGEAGAEAEDGAGDVDSAGDSVNTRRSDRDSDSDDDSDGDSDGDSDKETLLHDVRFEVRDCNGDGRLDVVVPGGAGHDGPLIFRGRGDLSFAAAVVLRPGGDPEEDRQMMYVGDLDGDGRADFVQLGRGKKVTIHQGRAACSYPTMPDRTIRLERKLRHLGLARIVDLDGDGRSDLYVVHPLKADDEDVSIPARVDLYLSRF